jgi:hypothetical protein
MLEGAKTQRLLGKLRERAKFKEFEQRLRERGKRLAENQLRVLLDETSNTAILGLANEGSAEIAHQLRIRLKANKEDELEENAEPQVQATACGQAGGEAVASAATLQPQFEGDVGGGTGSYTVIEGGGHSEICTSQWGYTYSCYSTAPALSLSSTSLQLASFTGQTMTAGVTVWNSGGGTLTGSATTAAPFSIVAGGSFSLGPGQPQTVTVRFAPGAAGGYSGSLQINSNGGAKTVALKGGTISVSPAQVSYTVFVGSPQEQKITLKNDGAVAARVTLSGLSAPYAEEVFVLVNTYQAAVDLSGGQSLEVGLRFNPKGSGSFSGSAGLSLSGMCVRWSEEVLDGRSQCLEQSVAQGSASVALAGLAHKISIEPEVLDFDIVFLNTTRKRRLIVKNEGTTTVLLNATINAPFSVAVGSSFTLAPSASQEVTAEISTTVSRTYMEKLRLTSGSASVEVPVVAAAMTREEYRERLRALLRGHNEAARQGFHNVAFAESWHSRCLHVFSGFQDLSLEQVESDINSASCEDIPEIDPVRLEEIEQAFEILEGLGAQQITQWLQLLKQALTEGRFDAEYQRLLPEGLGQFVEAKRLLLDLANAGAEELKNKLKDWLFAQDQTERLDYIWWIQRLAREEWYRAFWWSPMHILDFEQIRSQWTRILGLVYEVWGFNWDGMREFSHAMYFVLQSIGRANPLGVTAIIDRFLSFLRWMDTVPKVEQGVGTILAAAHAVFKGWQVKGFAPTTVGGQTAWVAELTLSPNGAWRLGALVPMTRIGPDGQAYDLKGIHATVLGHHCQQCGNLAKDIAGWLSEALRDGYGRPGSGFTTKGSNGRELNVFVVSFTRENPQGVDNVVKHLMGEFGNTHAVIMVVWIENGQVKWACVSEGCKALNPGEQEAIARSFANLLSRYFGHAVRSAAMVCGGDLDCMREVLETLWPECRKGGCRTGHMSRWQYSGIMGTPRMEEPVC